MAIFNTLNTKQLIYNLQPSDRNYLVIDFSEKYHSVDPELDNWSYGITIKCNSFFLYSISVLRLSEPFNPLKNSPEVTQRLIFAHSDYKDLTTNEAVEKLEKLKNSEKLGHQEYEIYLQDSHTGEVLGISLQD